MFEIVSSDMKRVPTLGWYMAYLTACDGLYRAFFHPYLISKGILRLSLTAMMFSTDISN